MAIKYEFPCYPGDEVWLVECYSGKPIYVSPDKVQMVGFTSRSIQIKTRGHHSFGKTYTWGKNIFGTEAEARKAFEKMKEEA